MPKRVRSEVLVRKSRRTYRRHACAMHAAFLAADAGEQVRMTHLLEAALAACPNADGGSRWDRMT